MSAERHDLTGLNAEERRIFARVSRRGFMGATAGATLAALAGSEAALARRSLGEGGRAAPTATADAVIVLWMAGGMAHTETFDLEGKRARATAEGVAAWVDPEGYRHYVAGERKKFEAAIDTELGVPRSRARK